MVVPRLVLALMGAAGLNAGLIVWSVVDRHTAAEVENDMPVPDSPGDEDEQVDENDQGDENQRGSDARPSAASATSSPADVPPSLPADAAPSLAPDTGAKSPADLAPSLPPDAAPSLPAEVVPSSSADIPPSLSADTVPSLPADVAPSSPPELSLDLPRDLPGELPGELPEVPSLEAMEGDPGFQDFLDIAVEQYPELEHLRDETDARQQVSADYYGRLQRRLEVVELLVAAANKMAAEGEEFSAERDTRRASEFLQKITQLREIAAGLLVEEL